MGKRQTFLSEEELSPSGELMRHLNVVVSEHDDEWNYLVVPITTYHPELGNPLIEQNNSLILETGEHSFITHKSWLCLSRAKIMSYKQIFNGLQRGVLINKEDISEALLLRIHSTAKQSKFLQTKYKHFLA